MSSLRDQAGCLTEAGLDALEQARAGEAPPDLAHHLAGCARCQDRLLARVGRSAAGRPARTEPRRFWMGIALVMAAMLAALVALLATLTWLQNPPE